MRIGLWIDDDQQSVDELRRRLHTAAEAGFGALWLSERGGWDPLTLLAAAGPVPSGVPVGTSIVRTYPRHPLALAAQVLTAQAATGNRLVLGLGPGPQPIIAGQYGYDPARPVENLREYLGVLLPLLRGEQVAHEGPAWHAAGAIAVSGVPAPPVYLSALGPRMLQLTGEVADGTLTTWTGPRTVTEHVLPRLSRAAAEAGRPVPAVTAGVCIGLTKDVDSLRTWVHEAFGAAVGLPSYRAAFDREGVAGPADMVLAGDETTLEREINRFAAAGVAELQIIPCGTADEQDRTIAFAAELSTRPASGSASGDGSDPQGPRGA
ncbi:hypothetical protein CC117_00045 [Parafrankia colletiae]|uniref:Luciferase-like domain-containing protein n=1 Tax=Parafrankia colletiae TaxID=573497 RepID=A0A1S1RMP6_9ACTN|nr:TIGR03564 family F420-dependent LLM class oxidoreductase [Parafrankia colletiae]MCK9902811.1 TIGR03564 family F420-dependent LLM class oxidoreductase [Frankia sp. Cpl3]OHV46675.1 hypothetical protein CC117_00045 [Parafrankia colletiae]